MTASAAAVASPADVLQRALGVGVRSLRTWPHPYSTTHPLTAADAELVDGRTVEVVIKESSTRPVAKPPFLYRRDREVETYRNVLTGSPVPAPRLLGVAGSSMVLERVPGVPLWQSADPSAVAATARAARTLHRGLAAAADAPFLVRYDGAFYRRWLRRACAVDETLAALARTYTFAAGRLLEEPNVVIHGELYPSNVLVCGDRVSIVDWEMAAVGPAVVDIAALTAGWSTRHQRAALSRYGEVDAIALDCARLHLAFRWIGWSKSWRPPREHAYDWRSEAAAVAARLEEAQLAGLQEDGS